MMMSSIFSGAPQRAAYLDFRHGAKKY